MPTYVALLRGIGPMNPNMKPAKLKWGFEEMGFKNVRTVISSGNVVFESASKSTDILEVKIEKALPRILGFNSTTVVRSQNDLEKLLKKNPAKGINHSNASYVLVTFLKKHSAKLRTLPKKGIGFKVLGVYKKEICIVFNIEDTKTPDMMLKLEKDFGKAITSRTWKTVERIVNKMETSS